MKMRRIIGVFLFTATLVYIIASFLALFQNQRVKLEKGMEETLKAYSEQESLNVKELNRDMYSLLGEKADISDLNQQKSENEGSFARIDKDVANVANEISEVENNISGITDTIEATQNKTADITERILSMENYNVDLTQKTTEVEKQVMNMTDKIITVENQIHDLCEKIYRIENLYNDLQKETQKKKQFEVEKEEQNQEKFLEMSRELTEINDKIDILKDSLTEEDLSQGEEIEKILDLLSQYEESIKELAENVLYYQFDENDNTLNIYGHKESEAGNE